MPPSSWNLNPARVQQKLGTPVAGTAVIKGIAFHTLAALASILLSRFGPCLALSLKYAGSSTVAQALSWLMAVYFLVQALNTYYDWQESKRITKEQAGLKPTQRTLLGLQPPQKPAGVEDALRQRKPAAAVDTLAKGAGTPITPPQRKFQTVVAAGEATPSPAGTAASDGRSAAGGYGLRGPYTSSPAGRVSSPFASRSAVATPEGLRHYLDAFSADTTPQGAAPEPGPASPYVTSVTQEQGAPSPSLQLGPEAPR